MSKKSNGEIKITKKNKNKEAIKPTFTKRTTGKVSVKIGKNKAVIKNIGSANSAFDDKRISNLCDELSKKNITNR